MLYVIGAKDLTASREASKHEPHGDSVWVMRFLLRSPYTAKWMKVSEAFCLEARLVRPSLTNMVAPNHGVLSVYSCCVHEWWVESAGHFAGGQLATWGSHVEWTGLSKIGVANLLGNGPNTWPMPPDCVESPQVNRRDEAPW